ncbi:hypothetical protein Baya_4355 [Bagarius yarrelli]|uniref:Uncharacterized protein n=1 Tax=Bagarius yarrelli TaxID=175774 RepID=A0A556TPY8_BAGYA|nr:hypothetical protein Baya_4355 [Bagarius yarrelli]
MFPTYHYPDDPDTGVRAASKLPINPLLPANAPQVTLLSKTKGAPYRHELLEIPMCTRRESTTWTGQNGFRNHIKPVKGETQPFYPKALKTNLRDWKNTLLELTANVLCNLEKSTWLTSYQLHYTGTGPTNPIKLDDVNEKTVAMITGGMNRYTAQLRERSYPVFLSSRPLEGRKIQRNPDSASLVDEVFRSNQAGFNNTTSMHDMCYERDCVCKLSELDGTKPQTSINKPALTVNDKENSKPAPGLAPHASQVVLQEIFNSRIEKKGKQGSHISPPILSRQNKGSSRFEVKKSSRDLGSDLLELQNSFSRTEAHQNFCKSLQKASVDLRDNHHAGRKHIFYGLNSYYFHG